MASVGKIKQTIARQEKRRTFLEKKMAQQTALAKAKLKKKDKRGAMPVHVNTRWLYAI